MSKKEREVCLSFFPKDHKYSIGHSAEEQVITVASSGSFPLEVDSNPILLFYTQIRVFGMLSLLS